ncbi:MAG: SRPBCC domain-containing protein [Chloroflexi bacterium]|nr:SRPBCC domain-containing protein [Chloroflexota bacterium]MBP7044220.1 SRPBCC domain-containing protein [Chloroflexota bacterium]
MADKLADREIVVTRLIDAPRELVFAAFTEQEHIEQWWAPKGATTHEMDVKPGGIWRYSQPARDGSLNPFKIKFIELDKPTRLVYDYGADGGNASELVRTTVTFEDQDGRTKVTLQLKFATAVVRKQAVKYGAIVGAMQALETLADYLATV